MDVLLVMKSTIRPTAAGLAFLALGGCTSSANPVVSVSSEATVSLSSPSQRMTTPAARKATAAKRNSAADRCDARGFASGDIYVRMKSPGTATVAQQLGGEWVWDASTRKCLTSVQMMIATAPQVRGSCTWVGYVADNPGYDVNATPARPLRHVVAASGPSC